MQIHEQNALLKDALHGLLAEIDHLKIQLHRKTRSPYPDGTHSDMVNINSDVLPQLIAMQQVAADALDETTHAASK